jgi:adenylate cyclase
MGKRKLTWLLFGCLLNGFVFGQQSVVADSLLKLNAKEKTDSNKVRILLALSNEYRGYNISEALKFAEEAKQLSEKINYPNGRALAFKAFGLVYVLQGKYVETIESYDQALAIFDSLGNKSGVANILSNQGTVYYNQADDAKALELYLKALQVAEQTTDSLRIATVLLNIGAVYSNKTATHNKALDYYFKALKLGKSIKDKAIVATSNANIGEIYFLRNEDEQALSYFKESLSDYEGTENVPFALNNLGKVYLKKKEYATAVKYHERAYDYAKKLDATLDVAQSLLGLGDAYKSQDDPATAIRYYKEAEKIALNISSANSELKNAYTGLAKAYGERGDYTNAFKYQSLLTSIKDSLYNIDTDQKLSGLQFNFDIQKKQAQVDLLTKDKVVQDLQLKRQRAAKNIFIAGMVVLFLIVMIIYRNYRNKIKVNKILDRQNAEIESLILNILPQEVAHELQKNGNATPRYYEKASILFTDFKSFSRMADDLSPQQVVTELNECFIAFDEIIVKYNLEKIKTIGDSYMCAGGVPTEDEEHYINIVKAGLEISDYMDMRNTERALTGLPPWEIRIGINTGPIVAGVVGRKKYAYDIWGGAVNIASRMESNGEPGRVNISSSTFELIKHQYNCTHRGKIYAKNVGDVDMYFVDSEILHLKTAAAST